MFLRLLKSVSTRLAATLRRWRTGSASRAAARDDFEQRLLAAIDRFERAFHCPGQLLRVLDPLAVTARGFADRFERRQIVEVDKRRFVAARRLAVRVHAERRAPD